MSCTVIRIAALSVALSTCAAAAAPDVPGSWSGFQASKAPADVQIVREINRMEWWQACAAWGREVRGKKNARRLTALREFLISDNLINGVDLTHVSGRDPEVGMTTCGAIAILGRPNTVNRTKGAAYERTQLVWRSRRIYAYTEGRPGDGNAVIRSIQY